MKAKEKRQIPSLGITGRDIYQNWIKLRAFPGEVIEGIVTGTGIFSFSARGDVEVCEHFRQKNGSYVSAVREPTESELDDFHEAIDRGWIQVEGRKRRGCGGITPFSDAGKRMRVYHQATGEPLAEWLETDDGCKWKIERDKQEKELEARYGNSQEVSGA